jgi:anaerobic selenocysteine-containing dehydrogenase
MERRDFFKISAITSAAAALDACGKPERQLMRFIPEEDLVPGIATWKPGVCTQCSAGCGLNVRLMEGDAEVIRKGQHGIMAMNLAKKLEGNPNHPVNRGKLCARGQAGIQATYHPDRLRVPMKLAGPRGSGQYQTINWDQAEDELVHNLRQAGAGSLAIITAPVSGQMKTLLERFAAGLDAAAPLVYEPLSDAVLRHANLLSFGKAQLPTVDIGRANYVVGMGADFLGTWNSPVAQASAYGDMRQGRPGLRGKLVVTEPRMSQTGANADEWLPIIPGSEGFFALGLAHELMARKLRPSDAAGPLGSAIAGWQQGLPDYTADAVQTKTGIPSTTVKRIAVEMALHQPAVVIVGGAPLAHTNGLFTALAVNALNLMLGSVGQPGGIQFMPQPEFQLPGKAAKPAEPANLPAFCKSLEAAPSSPIKVLLLNQCNPVYAGAGAWRVAAAFSRIPLIVSFSNFVDETSVLADMILPSHSPLETWVDAVPESGSSVSVAAVAGPAMLPLHETKATADVLLGVAQKLGGSVKETLPFTEYSAMLKAAFTSLAPKGGKDAAKAADDFWSKVQDQGGYWGQPEKAGVLRPQTIVAGSIKPAYPELDGLANEFPFYFQPFPSTLLADGSQAHLPWLQEAPDPVTSAMWCSWVELNPVTAQKLGIREGDQVEITSPHGRIEAPALLSRGISPDVVAMPMGQGHSQYGRYAENRGANPFEILTPNQEPSTGAWAWAGTRVKVAGTGKGRLILFAGGDSRFPVEYRER